MDEKKLDTSDSDSDITCNGGYPPVRHDPCGGVQIERKKGYLVDLAKRLVVSVQDYRVYSIEFPSCEDQTLQKVDLGQKNWHIRIERHGVVLFTQDAGKSVEITSPRDFVKVGTTNARRHPDNSEISEMTLDIDGGDHYCIGGCRFTVHYQPA